MKKLLSEAERNKAAYALARKWLLQNGGEDVTPELLEKYLRPKPRPDSINGIYHRILESAQSAHMKAGVIGGAIGGVEKLAPLLCGFEPEAVLKKYAGWESILNDVEKSLKPAGKRRRTSRSIWPQYCVTILSAARFMSQFEDADDFYKWVGLFIDDSRARPALPIFLAHEIKGFGFALACEFLKELGFINFAKPDVHLRDIFIGLNLCAANASDYELSKAVVKLASHAGVSPYNADKIFWLVGSGFYYDDKQVGNKGKVGGQKKEFIADAISRMP